MWLYVITNLSYNRGNSSPIRSFITLDGARLLINPEKIFVDAELICVKASKSKRIK